MSGGYDEGYRVCPCFWGRTPGSLVARLVELIDHFDGMKVLDAGCGEGKNAAFLANRGAHVDAVELSELALANARSAWPDARVNWMQGNVRTMTLDVSYDIVIAYGLLHCLSNVAEVSALVRRFQSITAPRGWNMLCAFNDRHQELEAHPGFAPVLVSHLEYTGLYTGWELIVCTDADLTETHPNNNITHTHSLTRILARRPR